jgi:two-component system response regulator
LPSSKYNQPHPAPNSSYIKLTGMEQRMYVLVGEKGPKEAAETAELFGQYPDIKFHIALSGDEVIEYLKGEGAFTDRMAHPFPSWMILNLKMPGRPAEDVVKWLQDHPECSVIPVIFMCETCETERIKEAYRMGARTVFRKPESIEEAKKLFATVRNYWKMAAAPVLQPTHKCP